MRQSVRVVGFVLTLLLSAIALASAQTGELTIAVATDPLTLDPRGASNIISWSLAYHIADPLVGKDKDLKIVPLLAESWDRPDPLTWRFKLRRGVKFQNGEDVTAAAVKATLDVMIDPELAKAKKVQVSAFIRGNFRTVERVEAPDPYTVLIKTKAPYRPMLLGLSQLGIAPASALDGGEAYVAHPVGAGPYKFVEYVPGSRLVLEANPTYWGAKPAFKRVVVRIIPENATRVAALQTGEVQAIYNVPPDAIDRLKGNKDLVVQETLTTRYNYLYLQNDRPPFNDKRVRLAINYALDKDQITRVIFKGLARPASARPSGRTPSTSPRPRRCWRRPGIQTGSSSSWARRSAASSTIVRSPRRWWDSSPRPVSRWTSGWRNGGRASPISWPASTTPCSAPTGARPTPTTC
jgi:peptide/nickel transport system substrate-binding protein